MNTEKNNTTNTFRFPRCFDHLSLRELFYEVPVEVISFEKRESGSIGSPLVRHVYNNLIEAEKKVPELARKFTSPMKGRIRTEQDPEGKLAIRFESWGACELLSN